MKNTFIRTAKTKHAFMEHKYLVQKSSKPFDLDNYYPKRPKKGQLLECEYNSIEMSTKNLRDSSLVNVEF